MLRYFVPAQIGFVFSNSFSTPRKFWGLNKLGLFFQVATKTLRHKEAEMRKSLRGPKGRGNLLSNRQRTSFLSGIGFVFRHLKTSKITKIPITTYYYFTNAVLSILTLGLFFQIALSNYLGLRA
jgi:hypothetical protein